MSLSHPNLFENYQTLPCYNIELQAVGIIYLYQGNSLKLLFLGRCLILRVRACQAVKANPVCVGPLP